MRAMRAEQLFPLYPKRPVAFGAISLPCWNGLLSHEESDFDSMEHGAQCLLQLALSRPPSPYRCRRTAGSAPESPSVPCWTDKAVGSRPPLPLRMRHGDPAQSAAGGFTYLDSQRRPRRAADALAFRLADTGMPFAFFPAERLDRVVPLREGTSFPASGRLESS